MILPRSLLALALALAFGYPVASAADVPSIEANGPDLLLSAPTGDVTFTTSGGSTDLSTLSATVANLEDTQDDLADLATKCGGNTAEVESLKKLVAAMVVRLDAADKEREAMAAQLKRLAAHADCGASLLLLLLLPRHSRARGVCAAQALVPLHRVFFWVCGAGVWGGGCYFWCGGGCCCCYGGGYGGGCGGGCGGGGCSCQCWCRCRHRYRCRCQCLCRAGHCKSEPRFPCALAGGDSFMDTATSTCKKCSSDAARFYSELVDACLPCSALHSRTLIGGKCVLANVCKV